jgi:hypothetical protein
MSWYEFEHLHGRVSDSDYTEDNWQHFARGALGFWRQFMRKWILDHKSKNIHSVSYADLVRRPFETTRAVAAFLHPDSLVHEQTLGRAVQSVPVHKQRVIQSFAFFNPEFCYALENTIRMELSLLHLPVLCEGSSEKVRAEPF